MSTLCGFRFRLRFLEKRSEIVGVFESKLLSSLSVTWSSREVDGDQTSFISLSRTYLCSRWLENIYFFISHWDRDMQFQYIFLECLIHSAKTECLMIWNCRIAEYSNSCAHTRGDKKKVKGKVIRILCVHKYCAICWTYASNSLEAKELKINLISSRNFLMFSAYWNGWNNSDDEGDGKLCSIT